MSLKFSLLLVSIFFIVTGCKTSKKNRSDLENLDLVAKEMLHHPFGTLLTVKVEIVDGDDLDLKQYAGNFLLKIISIEGKEVDSSQQIFPFIDETGEFPNNSFSLYEKIYGKKTHMLTSAISKTIKKEYVGKMFTVIVYETGKFTGIPEGYSDYQPLKTDTPFHFENYLIVVANLINQDKSLIP